MGMIAAIDGSQTGDIKATKWVHYGEQFGFSSPLIDGTRVYQIENGSRLKAYDLETGKELWTQPLGTSQKAPPVMADGKIFVGTENGKFFIVRPHRRSRRDSQRGRAADQQEQHRRLGRHCRTDLRRRGHFARSRLLRDDRCGLRHRPEAKKDADGLGGQRAGCRRRRRTGVCAGRARPNWCCARADASSSRAKAFDSRGRFLREEKAVWSLDGLKGTVTDGAFTVGGDRVEQAGLIKATVGTLTGEARARVVRPMPWDETFESLRRKVGSAGLGQRRRTTWTAGRRHARRTESAAEDAHQHALQARPRLHRSRGMVELHDAGRRARTDTTAHAWPTSASPCSAIAWCSTARRSG